MYKISPLLCGILFYDTFPLILSNKHITEPVPWDMGAHFNYAWVLHITFLTFALLLNGFCLFLVSNKKNRNNGGSMILFISALNFIDFIGSLGCLIPCALNYNYNHIYGKSGACGTEAVRLGFFIFWQAGVLAQISYTAERAVVGEKQPTETQAIAMIGVAAIYSIGLAFVAALTSAGGYKLYPSGTYCFFNMTTPFGGGGFALGILVPTAIMCNRYYRIWRELSRAQEILCEMGVNTKAKAKSALASSKMALFIFTFFGCAAPFLAVALFEVLTWRQAPYWLDIIGGVTIHFIAVINPILFICINDDIKKSAWHIVRPNHINKVYVESVYSKESEVDIWLCDKKYSDIFTKWCDENFVGENVRFYQDAIIYQQTGKKFLNELQCEIKKIEEESDKNQFILVRSSVSRASNYLSSLSFSETLSELITISPMLKTDWHETLYNMAIKIYKIYIQAPSAPLEINIPDVTRIIIEQHLRINKNKFTISSSRRWNRVATVILQKRDNVLPFRSMSSDGSKRSLSTEYIPAFLDIFNLSIKDAIDITKYNIGIYDESLTIVTKIIETDIFPRFKKSDEYFKMKNYAPSS